MAEGYSDRKVHPSRRARTLLVWGLVLISLIYGYFAGGQANDSAAGETVTIGYINWQEDVAVTYLWKEILQEQGYKVELKCLDAAPLYIGLSRGDIDLFLDAWLPITQRAYWEKNQGSLVDFGSWYQGEAKIGVVVPKYVTIGAIEELKARQEEFGGKLVGIDPGAGIMKAADKAIKDYKLNYQLVQGSEAAMMAALDKAYRERKWVAITGWSPHWMFAKYELKYLADSKKDFGEAEGLHSLANKVFAEKHPEVAAMIQRFKLNDNQIGGLEGLMQQGMEPQKAAQRWLKENRRLVDGWLAQTTR